MCIKLWVSGLEVIVNVVFYHSEELTNISDDSESNTGRCVAKRRFQNLWLPLNISGDLPHFWPISGLPTVDFRWGAPPEFHRLRSTEPACLTPFEWTRHAYYPMITVARPLVSSLVWRRTEVAGTWPEICFDAPVKFSSHKNKISRQTTYKTAH